MKKQLRRAGILLLFGLLVLALLKFQGKIFRTDHETHAIPELPLVPIGAQKAVASLETLPETQVYPGFVEAVDAAQISSRVMAAVLLVNVREGDKVKAGAPLVQLDDKAARTRLAQAKAYLQTAEAQALQANLAFDRAERLHDAEAITVQEWEGARASRDSTSAMRDQASDAVAEAQFALDWYTLEAPFDGEVLRREVDPGDLASPGAPLLQIYRPDSLRFAVAVPEGLVARLEVGQSHSLMLPKGTIQAKLSRILPSSDPRTGTVVLHFTLESSAPMLPGMLGRLQLQVGERKTMVLPAIAIQNVGQLERVQVIRDGHLIPVTIRTGKRHGDQVEILSGLTAGEEVLLP